MTTIITGVSEKYPMALRAAAQLQKQGATVYAIPQTTGDALHTAVDSALRENGKIDLLVCGAGTDMLSPAPLHHARDALPLYENGLWGACDACAAVLPHMRKSGRGKILLLCAAPPRSLAAQALLTYCRALHNAARSYGVTAAVVQRRGLRKSCNGHGKL